jgi:hypothetical protein
MHSAHTFNPAALAPCTSQRLEPGRPRLMHLRKHAHLFVFFFGYARTSDEISHQLRQSHVMSSCGVPTCALFVRSVRRTIVCAILVTDALAHDAYSLIPTKHHLATVPIPTAYSPTLTPLDLASRSPSPTALQVFVRLPCTSPASLCPFGFESDVNWN